MAYPNEVDVTVYQNETFSLWYDISGWQQQFPLASCKYRAQMRQALGQPVLYEWSTDNGQIAYSEAPASGGWAFTVNPTAGQVIGIGASTITFVASGATGLQVNIGVGLTATLTSLLALVQGSADSQVSLCTYTLNGLSLIATAVTTGAGGNLIATTTNVTGCTVNAATLTGGANLLGFMSPISATEGFLGAYVYDCRLEYKNIEFDVLFGGTLTFLQGVTSKTTDGIVSPIDIPITASVAITPSLINMLIFG